MKAKTAAKPSELKNNSTIGSTTEMTTVPDQMPDFELVSSYSTASRFVAEPINLENSSVMGSTLNVSSIGDRATNFGSTALSEASNPEKPSELTRRPTMSSSTSPFTARIDTPGWILFQPDGTNTQPSAAPSECAKSAPVSSALKTSAPNDPIALDGDFLRTGVFPFEKLSPELRNKVYRLALLSPSGWLNIIWDRRLGHTLGNTGHTPRKEIFEKLNISLLSLNKVLHAVAHDIFYGMNLFHFDFPDTLDCRAALGPHPRHNVASFLHSISTKSRRAIRDIRIYVSLYRLVSVPLGIENIWSGSHAWDISGEWSDLCDALAVGASGRHLTLVVVNCESRSQLHYQSLLRLASSRYSSWVNSLLQIKGLRSFNLHSSNCPHRDEASSSVHQCPTDFPIPRTTLHAHFKKLFWLKENESADPADLNLDILNQRYVENGCKDPVDRHLRSYYVGCRPNYVGTCFSAEFKTYLQDRMCASASAGASAADPGGRLGRGEIKSRLIEKMENFSKGC